MNTPNNIPNLNLLDLYILKMNDMLYTFNQVPLYRRENHHTFMKKIEKELRQITIDNNGYIPESDKGKGVD